MKQITILVILMALLAIGASALQVNGPTIGGLNQDRIKNVVTTFTFVNNNSAAMTGITYAAGSGAADAKYAMIFSGPSNLTAGATGTVTINSTIPLDHPGVDPVDLVEKAVKIGTVTVSGTVSGSTDTASADIYMQALNQLRVKKTRVDCDTKSQSVKDGDKIKNLKPGDVCTMEIEVENQFNTNDRNSQRIGDVKFDTIDVNIDSTSSDVDVDSGDSIDDLSAGDQDSVTSDVTIDSEASEGTNTVSIRVEGHDENGALHGEALDVRFEVKRLTHDLQIRRIELLPPSVSSCSASSVKVGINVLNQGKRDEKDAAVEVISSDLKFDKKTETIQLDKDDSTSLSFDLPVPKDAKEGVVRIDVKSFFDTTAPSNTASADLTISKCEDAKPVVEETPKVETKTTTVVPQTPVTPAGQAQAAPKKTSSFTESPAYVGLLAVLSILIAGAIVALIVVMMRRKRD